MSQTDELGTETDVEDRISDPINADVKTHEFEPDRSITERMGVGTERAAFATGCGVATVAVNDGRDIDIKVK